MLASVSPCCPEALPAQATAAQAPTWKSPHIEDTTLFAQQDRVPHAQEGAEEVPAEESSSSCLNSCSYVRPFNGNQGSSPDQNKSQIVECFPD